MSTASLGKSFSGQFRDRPSNAAGGFKVGGGEGVSMGKGRKGYCEKITRKNVFPLGLGNPVERKNIGTV